MESPGPVSAAQTYGTITVHTKPRAPSVLLLVAMPRAPSSVLAPSSGARSPYYRPCSYPPVASLLL